LIVLTAACTNAENVTGPSTAAPTTPGRVSGGELIDGGFSMEPVDAPRLG
jgi:hypothetical protein